ncbi:MAG: aminopeptidase [Clostridia bacterium]|nr:aminopeptidase [Clostridia bacterium]
MSELLKKKKNGYLIVPEEEKVAYDYCEGYKAFLNKGKIERFCVEESIRIAEEAGFVPFSYGTVYKPGDKVYYNQHGRAVIFAVIGSESAEEGFNITAAHVDCPRLDLKQVPLYEDGGLALMKTHYYGGIRKYQWVALPLALCGVVCKRNGETVRIEIGNDPEDPVFYITDLLPHLAKDQKEIGGEDLNLVVGSKPDAEEDGQPYKTSVMKILNEKYGLTEEDFETADISAVPAGNARDIGFDRSLISAYGHDDRICAYPELTALLALKEVPKKTCVAVFADREEVGSAGISGMRCSFVSDFLTELCGDKNARRAFANSCALSADVNAAFDPTFPSVYEKRNSAFVNHGIAVSKYTGSRGKSGCSEAPAELLGKLFKIFDDNNVLYQTSELGKVDQGGGGTVSQFLAERNILVVDVGVAMLSMHAPYEAAGKLDIYHMHKACLAFYENY